MPMDVGKDALKQEISDCNVAVAVRDHSFARVENLERPFDAQNNIHRVAIARIPAEAARQEVLDAVLGVEDVVPVVTEAGIFAAAAVDRVIAGLAADVVVAGTAIKGVVASIAA